jgi:hypothetical protein
MSFAAHSYYGAAPSVAAPTISVNASMNGTANISNANFTVGTYTGTITTKTVNSGPGTSVNYTFSGGTITYSGPLYLSSAGTLSLTVSNAGGSATSSGTLTVTGIAFALTTTNRSFASGVAINAFSPRTTILACTTSGNQITSGSVASGSIPPGTTLQFNQGGNGDVIISGTPTTPGTYNFTLQVYDGGVSTSSPATSGTITITIT